MTSLVGPVLKLSVFAVITIVVSYVLLSTVQNAGYGDSTAYRAQFTDVTGLVEGDDVRVAGVRVGQVDSIEISEDDRGNDIALVGLEVDSSMTLPTGVEATIKYRNLVGQRYVALTEGSGSGGQSLAAGDTIPLAQTSPALDLTQLFNGFQPLFQALDAGQLNRLSYEIIQVFQGEGGTVENLLTHVASLTSALADKDEVIGSVVDNLNSVLGTVAERDQELSDLVVSLQQFVTGLAADKDAIFDSLVSIDDLSDQTSALLASARPALAADIAELGELSGNVADNQDALTSFLEETPAKLDVITRTATSGSWFNFYLCGFSGSVTLPGDQVLTIPEQETCTSGG